MTAAAHVGALLSTLLSEHSRRFFHMTPVEKFKAAGDTFRFSGFSVERVSDGPEGLGNLLPEELPALFPRQLIVERARRLVLVRLVWKRGETHKSGTRTQHSR